MILDKWIFFDKIIFCSRQNTILTYTVLRAMEMRSDVSHKNSNWLSLPKCNKKPCSTVVSEHKLRLKANWYSKTKSAKNGYFYHTSVYLTCFNKRNKRFTRIHWGNQVCFKCSCWLKSILEDCTHFLNTLTGDPKSKASKSEPTLKPANFYFCHLNPLSRFIKWLVRTIVMK